MPCWCLSILFELPLVGKLETDRENFRLPLISLVDGWLGKLLIEIEIGGEATHAFRYIQLPSGTQYIVDGGPSGNCAPNCGYLHAWVTVGVAPFASTGLPTDTTSLGTWWDAGPTSEAVCSGATAIWSFGTYWQETYTAYGPVGPNSNTFAHAAADEADFAATPPPSAVG